MIDRTERYKRRLEEYYRAEDAILNGAQSYSLGGRSLTRANLSEITNRINYLENRIEEETARAKGKGKNRVVCGVPRDL